MKIIFKHFSELKIILLLALGAVLFCSSAESRADESFDSKGTDFWVTFLPNYHNNLYSNDEDLVRADSLYIFIVGEEPTAGTIDYTDRYDVRRSENFEIFYPGEVYTFKVSFYDYELWGFNNSGVFGNRHQSEIVSKMSFHVTSEKEITVYAHNQAVKTSEAFLVMPTDVLNNEYIVLAYNSDADFTGNVMNSGSTPSQFAIVGTQDNTIVRIKPAVETMFNGIDEQQITLHEGEVYLVQSRISRENPRADLTGTEILSNQPIAVFAGHQRTTLPVEFRDLDENPSRDLLVEQLPPVLTWGKNAFLVPFAQPKSDDNEQNDIYRILAAFDNTDIYKNDDYIITLNRGDYFQSVLTEPAKIVANSPILVGQYKKTSKTGGVEQSGDPFFTLIPPKEQFMKSYTVINLQAVEGDNVKVYREQFLTLVAETTSLNSVEVDGLKIDESRFVAIPGSEYSYANIEVSDGAHTVSADTPLEVFIYGFGFANSYGYVGGMKYVPLDMPPQIISKDSCNSVRGTVYDSSASDSGLKAVVAPPDDISNVLVDIDYFQAGTKDGVGFIGRLENRYFDGNFTLTAEDMSGQKVSEYFAIPGFTVRVVNIQTANDSVPYYSTEATPGETLCFDVIIRNYGSFNHTITDIFMHEDPFWVEYNGPPNLAPGDTASLKVCFQSNHMGVIEDMLTIASECGKRDVLQVIIKMGNCDESGFEYNTFRDVKDVKLIGDTRKRDLYVRMTSPENDEAGAMWHQNLVPVKDGFTSTFKFRFGQPNNGNSDDGSYPGADGLAFVVQNVSAFELGNHGGGLGYHKIPNSLAVEFDVFANDSTQLYSLGDPNGNHIAVQCAGKEKNVSNHFTDATLAITTDIPVIESIGRIYYAKIDYSIEEEHQLRVFFDEIGTFAGGPVIVVDDFNLSEVLELDEGVRAWVGFTASTGSGYQYQDIIDWQFCPVPTDFISSAEPNQLMNKQTAVYPNPADDLIHVNFRAAQSATTEIILMDYLGNNLKTLYRGQLSSGSHSIQIPTAEFPTGIYFVKINSLGQTQVEKLLIAR